MDKVIYVNKSYFQFTVSKSVGIGFDVSLSHIVLVFFCFSLGFYYNKE